MKISKWLDNQINKYSFNYIGWSAWFNILFFIAIVIIFVFCSQKGIGNEAGWYFIFFTPTVFIPFTLIETACIYFYLAKQENNNKNFHINNKCITANYFYRIFIIISIIFSIASYIALLFFEVDFIISSEIARTLLLLFALPLIISIGIFNFSVRKFFLDKYIKKHFS